MEPPILDVGAALVVRDGKYLVTQRRDNDSFGGFWEIPGGKKKTGESLEDCVVRELMEELGVRVKVVRFFRTATYPYPNLTVRLHIYLCRLIEGEPRPIECQAVAWTVPKDLSSFHFPDADQSLVHELSRIDPETLFE